MNVRLATVEDFLKFKQFLIRACYNWIYNFEKPKNDLPEKYESMSEEELDDEIQKLEDQNGEYANILGAIFLSDYIKKVVRYTIEHFQEDISKKSNLMNFIIENEGEIIGVFQVRKECNKNRIVTWSCKLECQNPEMLKQMLEALTKQLKSKYKKKDCIINYSVLTKEQYAVDLLQKIGFSTDYGIYHIL